MRKALFGVILVAASFAGGALVNGPGLRWAQGVIMNRLGMEEEGENHPDPPLEGIAPLAIEPSEITPDSDHKDNEKLKEKPVERAELASQAPSAPVQPEPAPLPDVKPEPVALPSAEPAVVSGIGPASGLDTAVSPTSNKPAAEPLAIGPSSVQGDWAEIRKRLREAGVARYGIEGEPGGQVRFQCVIPLAGRRAMSQHFEADGADEMQAARAVLKRINLWRATETEGQGP